eukprot:TRINITY_DN9442_c0_g4_i2.p1 TRINITY_DN9442_c0_g4~~TRINITY_DN9442_c0_g4_i2.p1  ORF type:complete len:203 (+),score=2.64 TRINITY_DN9442_c0_g4_i2:85-693(+)
MQTLALILLLFLRRTYADETCIEKIENCIQCNEESPTQCSLCSSNYHLQETCIPCAESTCASCDGSGFCESCPNNVKLNPLKGTCTTCETNSEMIATNTCVLYGEVGCTYPGDYIDYCICGTRENCCKGDKGVFFEQAPLYGLCKSCSKSIPYCLQCSSEYVCDRCDKGLKLTADGDKVLCQSFSLHLFTGLGLLVGLIMIL